MQLLANPPKPAVASPANDRVLGLAFAALGVVFGDIGTSPLYALRECFRSKGGVPLTEANVFGVLSLVFWSLVVIISIKYVTLVMRADNQGEGGILALMALAFPERKMPNTRTLRVMIGCGLFGAALLYGDGMITPAISVLSAAEGLKVATPLLKPVVIPLTILILIGLFSFQHIGTGRVGRIFAPITFTWFLCLLLLGLKGVFQVPGVLAALLPGYAIRFFLGNGWAAFAVLGSVFLVVTGGEALYADMGHFGSRPIRLAWFSLVLPSLLVNYFGQGALLLTRPGAAENPFYQLAPAWAIYPLVLLATLATVIASQALISGAFSLSMQAIQLGCAPRMRVEHTSPDEKGQIYVSRVNMGLMLASIGLVVFFQSSSNLAAAYGVAVTLTMIITTALFFFATKRLWQWPTWQATLLCVPFLVVEIAFFGANCLKIFHGGWFPLAIGTAVFVIMTTWKSGRRILQKKFAAASLPLEKFREELRNLQPLRVPGTAIYLSADAAGTPLALLHNLKHNKVLHERVVTLTIETEEVPHVDKADRVRVEAFADGFVRIIGHYGFMEDPIVPEVLGRSGEYGLEFKPEETTFFLGRQTVAPVPHRGLPLWRAKLFSVLLRNSENPTEFYRLPANQVVELGMRVEV